MPPLTLLVHDPIEAFFEIPEHLGPGNEEDDDEVRFVFDQSLAAAADAIVFHIPTLRARRPPRRPGQVWIAWSMESDAHYPMQARPDFMRHFDVRMTYHRDADVWAPYLQAEHSEQLRWPPRARSERAGAVFLAREGSDRAGRLDYVRELQRHFPVDCPDPAIPRRFRAADGGRSARLQTLARYRFTLAFESSRGPDYVTEQFFDPLCAGSVPVYLGAPNVSLFRPGERCHIDTADFAGPQELANHLRRLCLDEGAYGEYLAWKTRPFLPSFQEMLERVRVPALRRLARTVRARRDRPADQASPSRGGQPFA